MKSSIIIFLFSMATTFAAPLINFKVSDISKHRMSFLPLLKGKTLEVTCNPAKEGQASSFEKNQIGLAEAKIDGNQVQCSVMLKD